MSFFLGMFVLAALDAVFIVLSQVALWQRKEYRMDRMRAYIMSPESELERNVHWYIAFSMLCVAAAGYIMDYSIVMTLASATSMASIFIGYAGRAFRTGVARPAITVRSVAVIGVAFILLAVKLIVTNNIAQMALVVFASPVVVAFAVGIVTLPALLTKRKTIARATQARAGLHSLVTVGITGSVGKTSTKKYLVHLLGGESDTVIATSEHRNSPYVVAQDMLQRLSEKTKIYIAEMGAYNKGEIAELARLVQPSIGVITAITNQHVALFGSLENLVRAKWELPESIPEHGTLVLNKDDVLLREKATGMKQSILWFSLLEGADVSMSNIILEQDATLCTLAIRGNSQELRLPVISRGQMVPILAAAATALALGVSEEEIMARMETLPQLERTMQVRTGKNGALVIDDSYSASEASVRNAIDYMKNIASQDAYLILVPIIELGSEGARVHERIGTLLKNLHATVYMYGTAHKEDILRGLHDADSRQISWYQDPNILAREISSAVSKNSLVVLEGRVPAIIRQAIL